MSQQQSQNLVFWEFKASTQEGEEGEGDLVLVAFFRQSLSYHTFISSTYSPKTRCKQENQKAFSL